MFFPKPVTRIKNLSYVSNILTIAYKCQLSIWDSNLVIKTKYITLRDAVHIEITFYS